jgi:ABC-2 type transport system permease protein
LSSIAAVHVPANFDRDLKAERRPQVAAFYNQQSLIATGIVSQGLSDSLAAPERVNDFGTPGVISLASKRV